VVNIADEIGRRAASLSQCGILAANRRRTFLICPKETPVAALENGGLGPQVEMLRDQDGLLKLRQHWPP
jgi:hypothetical protein